MFFTTAYAGASFLYFDREDINLLIIICGLMHLVQSAQSLSILYWLSMVSKREKWRWVWYIVFVPILGNFHFFQRHKDDINGIARERREKMKEAPESLREFHSGTYRQNKR